MRKALADWKKKTFQTSIYFRHKTRRWSILSIPEYRTLPLKYRRLGKPGTGIGCNYFAGEFLCQFDRNFSWENTSSDWPVGKSVKHFLNYWRIWEGPVQPWAGGALRKLWRAAQQTSLFHGLWVPALASLNDGLWWGCVNQRNPVLLKLLDGHGLDHSNKNQTTSIITYSSKTAKPNANYTVLSQWR